MFAEWLSRSKKTTPRSTVDLPLKVHNILPFLSMRNICLLPFIKNPFAFLPQGKHATFRNEPDNSRRRDAPDIVKKPQCDSSVSPCAFASLLHPIKERQFIHEPQPRRDVGRVLTLTVRKIKVHTLKEPRGHDKNHKQFLKRRALHFQETCNFLSQFCILLTQTFSTTTWVHINFRTNLLFIRQTFVLFPSTRTADHRSTSQNHLPSETTSKLVREKNLTIPEFSADLKIITHVPHLWHAPNASFNALHLRLNLTTHRIGTQIFFPFGTVNVGHAVLRFQGLAVSFRFFFFCHVLEEHLSREPVIVDLSLSLL